MASKTDVQRSLGGKINLLPPADKIDPTEALVLRNFRSDTLNKLVCRGGSQKEFGPIGTGRFHTIFHGNNFAYNGIGQELYYGRDASTLVAGGFDGNAIGMVAYQGAVYAVNQGKQVRIKGAVATNYGIVAPATAPVVVGGGQLDTVLEDFEGTSGANNVTVASPTLSPVAPYNVAMTADVPQPGDDSAGAFADPDYVFPSFSPDAQSGDASLLLSVQQACTVTETIDPAAPLDTTFTGVAQDDDTFQFWIQVSDPTRITSFSVSMADAATGYVECNFQPDPGYGGTFFPPSKFLSQVPGQWIQVKIKRNVNLDNWSAQVAAVVANPPNQQSISDIESQYASAVTSPAMAYIGTGSPQTGLPVPPVSANQLPINWGAITSINLAFVTSGAVDIYLDRFEVVGTVSANITGSINYYVSFFNADLQDSDPSPASNYIIAGNESPTLTSIPTSPDPQVTGRYIWRIGGGISQALQVGIIPDNVTTGPWIDGTTNAQAQNGGVNMPINRDPAPAGIGITGPFFGKLIAWNTPDHPARYFWNNSAQPWFFPGSNDDFVGNWEDVGGDDDAIMDIIMHPTIAVIYKQRSIWRLPGDPAATNVSAVRTNAEFGIVGPQAACNDGAIDYIVGPEGVFSFNLDSASKISMDIDPIFKGDFVYLVTENGGEQFLPPINRSAMSQCILVRNEDRLRLSYPSYYSSVVDTVAVYHIPSARWVNELYDNLPALAPSALTYGGISKDGLDRALVGGFTGPDGGYCYLLEQPYTDDDGQPIRCQWQTPFYDQGLPEFYKWFSDLELEFVSRIGNRTPAAALNVMLLLDNGARVIELQGTYANTRQTVIFRLEGDESLGIPAGAGVPYGLRAKNWAVLITVDVYNGVGLEIYGLYMHFFPEERVADTYDSNFTNLGIPERCKEFDYLEMYVTASGGELGTSLATDLPGNVLTFRDAWGSLPAPNGRGTLRYRLPNDGKIDGRNIRLQVFNTPTGRTFQMHQMRLRMRPIGEYIDGTIGEYYESPEFSIQPNRVGELKSFLLDYDVSAEGGSFELYSDLPGTELVIRRTLPIPFQDGARGIYVFPLESALDTTSDDLPNGQLFKIRLYPPPNGVLRLHGRAQFKARIIGTYFNGANGEIWESQPVDLLGGVGVFREACVVAQTAGPMLFEFFQELPNKDLRLLGSFSVNTAASTPGRLPVFSRFPGATKGQLVKARISGPYICRLFEVKVFARRLMTNSTGWDWVSIPQIDPTPDSWTDVQVPGLRSTPEEFSWIELPVDNIG